MPLPQYVSIEAITAPLEKPQGVDISISALSINLDTSDGRRDTGAVPPPGTFDSILALLTAAQQSDNLMPGSQSPSDGSSLVRNRIGNTGLSQPTTIDAISSVPASTGRIDPFFSQ